MALSNFFNANSPISEVVKAYFGLRIIAVNNSGEMVTLITATRMMAELVESLTIPLSRAMSEAAMISDSEPAGLPTPAHGARPYHRLLRTYGRTPPKPPTINSHHVIPNPVTISLPKSIHHVILNAVKDLGRRGVPPS